MPFISFLRYELTRSLKQLCVSMVSSFLTLSISKSRTMVEKGAKHILLRFYVCVLAHCFCNLYFLQCYCASDPTSMCFLCRGQTSCRCKKFNYCLSKRNRLIRKADISDNKYCFDCRTELLAMYVRFFSL